MNYITTTQLRTKSKELLKALEAGESISLVHRSRIVGKIEPDRHQGKILTSKDITELKKIIKEMNLPHLSYRQREKNYRDAMEKKHGKGLSRR